MKTVKTVTALFAFLLVSLCARPAMAQSQVVVNHDGGWCIDAEGGRIAPGTKLIAYPCNGNANQQVTLDGAKLKIGGLCAESVTRDKGSEVKLQNCSNDLRQNFAWHGNKIGHNTGYVLAAAGSYFPGNRPLCLWSDDGRSDQTWTNGRFFSGYKPNQPLPSGTRVVWGSGVMGSAGVVASGGGNVVAAGGGNVVAAGGGNIVVGSGS